MEYELEVGFFPLVVDEFKFVRNLNWIQIHYFPFEFNITLFS